MTFPLKLPCFSNRNISKNRQKFSTPVSFLYFLLCRSGTQLKGLLNGTLLEFSEINTVGTLKTCTWRDSSLANGSDVSVYSLKLLPSLVTLQGFLHVYSMPDLFDTQPHQVVVVHVSQLGPRDACLRKTSLVLCQE